MTNAVRLSAAVFAAVSSAAPIDGVLMGDIADRRTWRAVFQDSATPANRSNAQVAINAFDTSTVDSDEATETSRQAALKSDASQFDLMQRLKTATPAQIDAWLVANVTNLAQARTVLGAIIKYLARTA